MGRVNSAPPGIHAGNLDNKELVAGTTLYIPVWTKGALLEIGDGHAGQGNGEVDITAMETSLISRMQLVVRKDMHLTWPRGETPTHYIAMGTDSALVKATKTAVRQAIELLVDVKGTVARGRLPAGERVQRRRHHAARGRHRRRARDDPEGDLHQSALILSAEILSARISVFAGPYTNRAGRQRSLRSICLTRSFGALTYARWTFSADPPGKSCRLNVFCRVRQITQVRRVIRRLMW